MNIVEIKAKKFFAGAGNFVWLAEAQVEAEDGSTVYATVDYYDGEEYTVQGKSMYAFLAEDGEDPCVNFDECYTSFDDAQKSKYAGVFAALKNVIEELG